MPHIIGITGLAGAGKDTLARAMQHWFGTYDIPASIVGFADPIRDVCKATGLLDPHNRGTKEVPVTIARDVFCDSLQYAIDTALRDDMAQHMRVGLYELMVQHTEQFTSEAVGSEFTQYMNISPRQFMQILGTEAGQALYKEVWVDILLKRVGRLDGVALVPDYRFMHETWALRYIVLLDRPGCVPVNAHVSEELPRELLLGTQYTHVKGRPVYRVQNGDSAEFLQGFTAAALVSYMLEQHHDLG